MNRRLRAGAEAKEEFAAAARHYEHQQAGLGQRFIAAIDDAFHRIGRDPLVYRLVEGNIRRCRVHRFPYAIIYRVGPQGD